MPSLRDEMLTITNFTGHPSLTLRAGFVEVAEARSDWAPDPAHPLPTFAPPRRVPHGVTLIGRLFDEGTLGQAGSRWSARLAWRRRTRRGFSEERGVARCGVACDLCGAARCAEDGALGGGFRSLERERRRRVPHARIGWWMGWTTSPARSWHLLRVMPSRRALCDRAARAAYEWPTSRANTVEWRYRQRDQARPHWGEVEPFYPDASAACPRRSSRGELSRC